MKNKTRPDIPIEIGGKKRHLRFDLNAMAEFEEATGTPLTGENISKVMSQGGAKALRALLWACLLHEDENLTLKEVGSWVNLKDINELPGKILEAFEAAMPEPEEGAQGKAPLAGKKKK